MRPPAAVHTGSSPTDAASRLVHRMDKAKTLERGALKIEAERDRRELEFPIVSTESRVIGRQPDPFGAVPGTCAHDVRGRTLADQGGGVVMPGPLEPVSAT